MNDSWKPTASQQVRQARAKMLAKIRQFFENNRVLEVETPLFSAAGATDPMIESFTASGAGRQGYLSTSPEFHMKRLLANGCGDIYQISRSFRAGEAGKNHNPEFSILEWYRLNIDHKQLAAEVTELLAFLNAGQAISDNIVYHRYIELFSEYLQIDLNRISDARLRELVTKQGVDINVMLSRDACLDYLLAEVVFKQFADSQLTVIYDYPASQASLARLDADDPRFASRFEILWGNLEIANGFHELQDPVEQMQRFEKENEARSGNNQKCITMDHWLIDSLHAGLPDCAGVAIGLDRVLMKILNLHSITEVLNFPIDRA